MQRASRDLMYTKYLMYVDLKVQQVVFQAGAWASGLLVSFSFMPHLTCQNRVPQGPWKSLSSCLPSNDITIKVYVTTVISYVAVVFNIRYP